MNTSNFINLIIVHIKNMFKFWSVNSRIIRGINYIKLEGYENGEIYDFYIPYSRTQRYRYNKDIRNVVLVTPDGEHTPIKMFPGCKLELQAVQLDGKHFIVESKSGELYEKEYLH